MDQPNTIFVDTGDILNQFSSSSDNDIVAGVFPHLGYDAICPGDQEFIDGMSFYKNKLNGKLPFISTNLSFADKELKIEEYKIITLENGLKVGITGVNFNTGFRYLIRSEAIAEGDVIVDKAFEKLRNTLKKLNEESDLVVVLAHFNREGIVKTLDHVDGYDILIGGHKDIEFYHPRLVDGKVFVQNGNDGEKIGKVVFDIDDKGKKKFTSYELIKVLSDKYTREKNIEKMIKELEE
ncbi:MAG: hypothetical protein PF638_05610 [Candidatus Delongbacteria bacterium]|jgi:2',3'-cyclic-nucleotide 2'-phosphodiesterase (5'-nucleotidase family)|nr:hypothetical protein [Candidatus Delongbacteria bacterium]